MFPLFLKPVFNDPFFCRKRSERQVFQRQISLRRPLRWSRTHISGCRHENNQYPSRSQSNLHVKNIVRDLEVMNLEYGEPLDHENAEARSRFLAPVSEIYPPDASIPRLFFSLLTLIPVVQPDGRAFQLINHPQYSRIHHTWPYDNKRAH
jgi:hypothetical protein